MIRLDPAEQAALRRSPGPGFRRPMLATPHDRGFSDDGWVFERKLDGVRAIVSRDGGTTALWSRNELRMDGTYPELVDALDRCAPERFVADGEVVAFDGRRTSFARLQQRLGISDPARARRSPVAVHLYLFDLLVLGDVDLTGLPLRTRKRLLRDAVSFTEPLRFSTHRNGDGDAHLDDACRRGWEGLIGKRASAPYRGGRSRDWLKLKCVLDQEFVVGGFTDPSGSRSGFGALLVGYHDERGLRYAGKVGTGYDQRTLTSMRARLDGLARRTSPFVDRVAERGTHWVAPELVAQVSFTEWTGDGLLRHPRFQGLRTDKAPADVVRETR